MDNHQTDMHSEGKDSGHLSKSEEYVGEHRSQEHSYGSKQKLDVGWSSPKAGLHHSHTNSDTSPSFLPLLSVPISRQHGNRWLSLSRLVC
jgi:hypothetical protein